MLKTRDSKRDERMPGWPINGVPVKRQVGMIYWYSWGKQEFDIRTMRRVLGLAEEQAAGRLKIRPREVWTGGETLTPAMRRTMTIPAATPTPSLPVLGFGFGPGRAAGLVVRRGRSRRRRARPGRSGWRRLSVMVLFPFDQAVVKLRMVISP